MRDSTLEFTLEDKDAFEKLCAGHGVSVQRYYTYNGRFADPAFRKAVSDSNQIITYCGLGLHHHNSITERHIR